MKSLSLVKPLVLVTVGLPGAGKSFFARQFSQTFGAPMIHVDRLRHILGSNDEQTLMQLIEYQFEELFKTQKSFVVDGIGATRAERVELRKKVKNNGYDVLLLWVQTDKATSQYRSMKRSPRREDDKYNQSLTNEAFAAQCQRFYPPAASEPSVVMSGKHTYATQARVVLKKLVVPRAETVNSRPIVGLADHTPPKPRRNVLIR